MSRRLPLSECLSWGCLAASRSLWASCLPSAPFPESPWNAETVLCGGNRAHQLAETNGGGRDEMDGAHGWASQREVEKKEKRKQRKEAKREESQRSLGGIRGQEWGSGMVSSPSVSINSCLGVGLCALCFSSYCLGIPVGTLPAPMLGYHHHPNHSDQTQRGTSAG